MTGAAIIVGAIMLVGALLKLGGEDSPELVRKKLAQQRLRAVGDLADGEQGAIRGVVANGDGVELVESPFGRRPCVYWRLVVEEVGTGGDHVELGRAEAGVPFLLRTDSGPARVVPDKPRLAIYGQSLTRLSVEFDEDLVAIVPKLRKANHPGSSLRITEYRIEQGKAIIVAGAVARETDPDATNEVSGYRAALPTRPVISGSRRAPLLIADAP